MNTETVMREVVTKAVCAKGQLKQHSIIEFPITTPKEIQVLGSHITKPKLNSALPITSSTNKKLVKVDGQYDLHVWYALGQDTHSVKKTVNYIETIPLTFFGDEDYTNPKAHAEITSRPKCTKTYVTNEGSVKKIKLEIKQGLAAEVVGMTKLFVKSIPFVSSDEEDEICGQELVPPKLPDLGLLVPEFYPDQLEDICEEDLEK